MPTYLEPGTQLGLSPVVDNFNRANANPLDGSWSNKVRSTNTDMQLTGNQVSGTSTSGSTPSSAWYNAATYTDTEVALTFATFPAVNEHIRLYVRITDPGGTVFDGYFVRYTVNSGTDTIEIFRVDDGTATAALATLNEDWSTGDRMIVRMVGSRIMVYRSSAALGIRAKLTVVDSTYAGPGYAGIGAVSNGTFRGDDFQVFEIPDDHFGEGGVVDDFNRSNESPIAGNWAVVDGGTGLDLDTNRLSCGTSTTRYSYYTPAQYQDIEAYITMSVKGAAGDPITLFGRAKDIGANWDSYMARANPQASAPDNFEIVETTNGTGAVLLTALNEVASGEKLGMRIYADVIESWWYDGTDWWCISQITDATLTAPGYIGVGIRGTTAKADDFSFRPLFAVPLSMTPSGTDIAEYVDAATAILTMTPSATEEFPTVYTDSDTIPVVITPSGTDSYGTEDAATVGLVLTPSGVDVKATEDVATVYVTLTPSAVDEGPFKGQLVGVLNERRLHPTFFARTKVGIMEARRLRARNFSVQHVGYGG